MYCSVSNIKNWLLNDPILDYLKLYGDKNKQSSTFFNECNFSISLCIHNWAPKFNLNILDFDFKLNYYDSSWKERTWMDHNVGFILFGL